MKSSIKRVLLASLWHQTNTFSAGRTGIEDFRFESGEDAVRDGVPGLDGVRSLGSEKGWELLPAVFATAPSGPVVSDIVVELFWDLFLSTVENGSGADIDGVFLLMHGAMVSESFPDVEGEVLRRIRSPERFSDVPICGVLDLHANFTETMCREADGLIACRNDSGEDARKTAYDAALLLNDLMETESRPVTLREHPPLLWPPAVATSNREPMLTLQSRARILEHEIPDMSFINVFAGFPYSDVPEAGVSFTAIADGDLELARSTLRELNVLASSKRKLHIEDLTASEAVARSKGRIPEQTLVLEASDDVENGAFGSSRIVLNALVKQDAQDALVVIHDTAVKDNLKEFKLGDVIELIGDKELRSTRGRLISKEDSHAVVKVHGVTVLLIGTRTPMDSFERLRAFGIEPEDYSVIVLKSSKKLNPLDDTFHWNTLVLDSPGATQLHLERLFFKNVTRPVYPLDAL
ncbi:M81 family metallopeptidase [Rubrobacter radiotolerans]|uniref:M81 family metallopeptidase n=1 Tax=Rubrobacter radiotolerans TaxID=42256 RepID=A0AB35TD49_RUBRA|nr:M81 family metallopeptidase [Rubrobacter radiotolerans]MDX5895140.1 M81 family metallopeptidase [Rubrobacter radiotolerans]SMC07531.1 Microcystin degradation protein MlrC, contains DUF1485 domain [Rubrobacter radiotolerans DSM 5868]